jgi:hypothetical protein
MVFRAGWRHPCTWNVPRLSESVKNISCGFLSFPKILQHPMCMNETVLHGKPFDIPLIQYHSSIKFLGKNLALGKPTLQSSVVEEGISSNAVDGNRHPDYSEKSCIQTDNQIESWWRVDLQDDFYVTSVVITNRRDCCSERLYHFEIKASGHGVRLN